MQAWEKMQGLQIKDLMRTTLSGFPPRCLELKPIVLLFGCSQPHCLDVVNGAARGQCDLIHGVVKDCFCDVLLPPGAHIGVATERINR